MIKKHEENFEKLVTKINSVNNFLMFSTRKYYMCYQNMEFKSIRNEFKSNV